MKTNEKAGSILILIGFFIFIWQVFYYPIFNPQLTQSQLLISNWEWFFIGTVLMVVGGFLFEGREG